MKDKKLSIRTGNVFTTCVFILSILFLICYPIMMIQLKIIDYFMYFGEYITGDPYVYVKNPILYDVVRQEFNTLLLTILVLGIAFFVSVVYCIKKKSIHKDDLEWEFVFLKHKTETV